MDSFTVIPSSQQLKDSLTPLMNNDQTLLSCSAGIAFPTTNLVAGRLCLRTDLGTSGKGLLHQLQADLVTWKAISDLGATYITQEIADGRYGGAGASLSTLSPPTGSVNMNSQKLINLQDPTSAQDAATKNYVDSAVQGLDVKQHCRVLSATNINLANPGLTQIDGVTLAAGDRVLLTGQTTTSQNGIYVFNGAAVAMTRAVDASVSADVHSGMYSWITEGAVYGDSGWILTTLGSVVLGTSALSFSQFSGAAQITAGTGLAKVGNTLSLGTMTPTGSGAKAVADAYGRIGSYTALAVADIPALPFSKITSGVPNYAVRGDGVSEFPNDAGYVTSGTAQSWIAGGWNSLFSYAVIPESLALSVGWASPGNIGAWSGFSGSWETMSYETFNGADGNLCVLAQRVG